MTFACMSRPNPSASISRRGISGVVAADWSFKEHIAATAAGVRKRSCVSAASTAGESNAGPLSELNEVRAAFREEHE